MGTNKFYDIHFHSLDLSHANLTAFIARILDDNNIDMGKLEKKGVFKYSFFYVLKNLPEVLWSTIVNLPKKIIGKFSPGNKKPDSEKVSVNKIRNLLSFMESSVLFDFLIIEHFLKNKEPVVSAKNEFKSGGKNYNKIVLCPLVVDFGYKNIHDDNIFYNIPPQKPIVSQITDLFDAVRKYYNYEITIKNENGITKFEEKKVSIDKGERLFEIYPFMGLNPENYSYNKVEEMLNKYFSGFSKSDTKQDRQKKLYDKMGKFNGNLEDEMDCKNIFAGIKLYPPLGFDPWPDKCEKCADNAAMGKNCECSRAKAELIYRTCVERNIPVITHCSNGGFKVSDNSEEVTNPGTRWAKVLGEYPELKINFAHFGSGDDKWQQTITEHILKPGSNVYTDFSCNTENDQYYGMLQKLVSNKPEKLSERILFGSDFMINLLWIKSYNDYLKCFAETKYLDDDLKLKFANTNSEMFLFG